MKVFIHTCERDDMDPEYPMFWTEYRISEKEGSPDREECLEIFDSSWGNDLQDAVDFCEKHGWDYEIVVLN